MTDLDALSAAVERIYDWAGAGEAEFGEDGTLASARAVLDKALVEFKAARRVVVASRRKRERPEDLIVHEEWVAALEAVK